MAICYIVGAGDFDAPFTPDACDLVIAADGGYDSLVSYGIRCDLLIGDCDSIKELPCDTELIRFPERKDYTDSFLAYFEGAARGYTSFEIHGGTGGREDHTQANIALLLFIRERGHFARLVGRSNTSLCIMNESITLTGERGKHISLFAIGSECEGVSIKGLSYEAENISLTPSFPLAVSNLFTDKEAEISVRRGALLIMTEN